MKSKINLKVHFTNAVLAAALAAAGSATAQTLPKQGSYDFTACYSGIPNPVSLSKAYFGFSYEILGAMRSNPPGAIMDNATFHCVGLTTSLGGKNANNALCETIDRDGDKQLATILLGSDGKTVREVIAGTGKYEGMEMTGTVVPLGPFPTIKPGTSQTCNHQTGTYKLK